MRIGRITKVTIDPFKFKYTIEVMHLPTYRSIEVRQLLRSQFDGSVASFRNSAEDGHDSRLGMALLLARIEAR